MPYIKVEDRENFDPAIDELIEATDDWSSNQLDGQLNYIISRIVAGAFNPFKEKWSYHQIARVMAVFECAKMEFYRRVAGPKEDKAIETNGDLDEYRKG